MLSDQSIISLGPGIKSVSDINKAAIRDQIQVSKLLFDSNINHVILNDNLFNIYRFSQA